MVAADGRCAHSPLSTVVRQRFSGSFAAPFFRPLRAVIPGGEKRRTPDASYHQQLEPRGPRSHGPRCDNRPSRFEPAGPEFFRRRGLVKATPIAMRSGHFSPPRPLDPGISAKVTRRNAACHNAGSSRIFYVGPMPGLNSPPPAPLLVVPISSRPCHPCHPVASRVESSSRAFRPPSLRSSRADPQSRRHSVTPAGRLWSGR
jgi:hypothetical protein